jgi:rhodanese-related sulfurtransferase
MRTRIAFACCVIALVAAFQAGSTAQSADAIDAPRIDQSELKKLVAAKNVVIVDTRHADVFATGHMPGALLLPLEGQLTWPEAYEKTVATLVASKKMVVTYCA